MLRRLLRAVALLAYAAVVGAVFILAAYISFSLWVRSGATTVPALRGMTRADAARTLADRGLRLRAGEAGGRYDDEVPVGHVLAQSPFARTPVKRGSGVEVTYSLGPQRIEVPALAGRAVPAAQVTLSGVGLAVGRLVAAFERRRDPGTIVAQHPPPGVTARPQSRVDLLLALPTPGAQFLMPDLVYRRYEEVGPFFDRHGFRLGSVRYERYEGVPAGTVLRQFPLPGHPVTRRDAVSLTIATAAVPDDRGGVFGPPADEPPPAGTTPVPEGAP
ncbi:MAG TPA: PASTA domain-containing protein [Thermoanaerobaculia bacterium]|nr:PASTA domain-containing protein [Thermoanaerobaculia bacterium]